MSATASSSGSVCSYILVDICNWDLFNSNPTKPSWMETEKILIFCSTLFYSNIFEWQRGSKT